ALEAARRLVVDPQAKPERRSRALEALAGSGDATILEAARTILPRAGTENGDLLRELLAGLGRLETPDVATAVLAAFDSLPQAARPQALDLLTQRRAWATALLEAVEKKRIERSALNVNQVRRIVALEGGALAGEVTRVWGQVRSGRNPEREKLVARMRGVLAEKPGDPWKGKEVFEKTCLQCHLLFGKGNNVGPDLTVNGRETLDALLTNVLDPNLVIGKDYY